MSNMQMVLSEQEVFKCAQAYALFVKARDIIRKGENYVEGLNLLKQMYGMVGEDGLQQVSYLENLGEKKFPFFWLHQNLQQSKVYFLKGYDMLKKSKGAKAPETENYKEQYVNFICWETATAHFEQTLWVLTALIPLLMIMVPVISGLHWKSLGVAFIILGAVLAWRTISIFFYFFMAKRHYEQAFQ